MDTSLDSSDDEPGNLLTPTERLLKAAILEKDIPALQAILHAGEDFNIDFVDTSSDDLEEITPLMLAAKTGNQDAVNLLIAYGANLSESSQFGQTALHLAAQEGHTPIIHTLIQAGMNPNKQALNGTAIQAAISYGHVDAVKEFLKHPCELTSELLSKAVVNEHHKILEILIEAGVPTDDPERTDGASINTPLHVSCSKADYKATEMLIKAGANVNAIDPVGLTPLLLATRAGQVDIISLLIEHGADVNTKDRTFSRLTACHYAAQLGLVRSLQCLLHAGSDINILDQDHCTPLFRAITTYQESTSIVLIKENCDVNIEGNLLSFTNPTQSTRNSAPPLFQAYQLKLYNLAKFLILAGTNTRHIQQLIHDLNSRPNFLRNPQDGDFVAWVERKKLKSLQHACRLQIRSRLRAPLSLKLKELPLPQKLQEYLLYPEVQVPIDGEDKPSPSDVAASLAYYMPARWLNPDASIYAGD